LHEAQLSEQEAIVLEELAKAKLILESNRV